MPSKKLTYDFFRRPVLEVTRDLLGRYILVHDTKGFFSKVKIIETEAYHFLDPACHAHVATKKKNPYDNMRYRAMAEPPGTLYVYKNYGIHWMLNVVVEKPEVAAVVLVRAVQWQGEPHPEVLSRRSGRSDLANGPGKLTQALGIDQSFHGLNSLNQESPLNFLEGEPVSDKQVVSSTRIGLTKGEDLLWRFYIDGNQQVSKGRTKLQQPFSPSHLRNPLKEK